MADKHQFNKEHQDATSQALNQLTDEATDHKADPKKTLHRQSDKEHSHSFLQRYFPQARLESIENSFHMGNYVIDRQTGQKNFEPMSIYVRVGMHALYYGSEQEYVLQWPRTLALLKAQSEKMGKEYDDPRSVDHIQPFIESFGLQDSMKEMVQSDPTKYKTFNEFFSREIKPEARPPAQSEDPYVVSSVADSRTTVFPTIDQATRYWIKGYGFTLAKLLNSDSVAQEFDGGSIAIARLAPQDYHRWHSPVDGVVESITEVDGTYYTVNPQAINEPGTLNVFCQNRRSVMIIKRFNTNSRVAVIAVGAMLVGSIVYNPGIAVGSQISRAQCLGKFQYGGSTVITLYQKGDVDMDADLVKNSTEQKCETLVRVGERIGRGPKNA